MVKKTVKYFCELVAALVATLLVLSFIAVWRLAGEPVHSTYLTPYVQSGLSTLFPNATAEIGSTLLVWDNTDKTIAMRGDNVVLRDGNKNVLAVFPSLQIKLSALGLLQGQLVPAELGISKPRIRFERTKEGRFAFSGFDVEASDAVGPPTQNEEIQQNFVRVIGELTEGGLLQEIAVTDAVVVIHDVSSNQDWVLSAPEITLARGWTGLKGTARIAMAQGGQNSSLAASYRYDTLKDQHGIAVKFNDINPSLLAAGYVDVLGGLTGIDLPLSGEFTGFLDKNLKPLALTGRMKATEGKLNLPDIWDAPRQVKSFAAAITFDPATSKFKDTKAEIDFGGTKLDMVLEGQVPPNPTDADLAFVMKLKVQNLLLDQYAEIWPKVFVSGARDWIIENMTVGVFPEATATLTGSLKWNDIANMTLDSADGKISINNARVQYIEGVPAVEGVSGEGTFNLKGMDIALQSGFIGNLKLSPSVIKMTGFDEYDQYVSIPVKVSGPVREVLTLIDSPPLGYAKAAGLKPDDLDGRVEGTLELSFPLLKSLTLDQVNFKADAKLTALSAPKMIPAIEISQGNLSLALDQEGFSVKGPALLNKVPLDVSLEQTYSPKPHRPDYLATASGNVTVEQWKMLGVDAFSKGQGTSALSVKYVRETGKVPQIQADVNFKQAGFLLDQLNWEKTVGQPAKLMAEIELPKDKPAKIKTIDLQGQSVKVKGSGLLDDASGKPLLLDLKPMVIGRTNATLRFSQTVEDTGALRFVVNGESFDVSGIRGGNEPAPADPRPKDYTLKVKKLFTSQNGFISNVSVHAQRDKSGWNEISLKGMADGTHPLDITLAPQSNDSKARQFSASCGSFGKMLKGMGFSDSVEDGAFSVVGKSSPEDKRKIVGNVKIGSFSVSDLPVLARLLGAASPFGFADFVTGRSSFDHLKGQFAWYGDMIDLQQVRAAGSVFAVNVDGHVDLNSGQASLHGTLVPFSFFNKVINSIPLLGDLITGGERGGIIAASYTVKGSLADPDISVNPVSLLTPGFLRSLIFEGEDEPIEPVKPK